MTKVCKTWQRPIEFLLPLCANKFEPIEGQGTCPVCATPILVTTNVCGCPSPLTDGVRNFRLTVGPGINGVWGPFAGFYGEFTLTNGGTGCESYYQFPPGGYFGSRWTVKGSTPPVTISGKLWRHVSALELFRAQTSQLEAWAINMLPACDNHQNYSSGAYNASGYNDWFRIALSKL